MGEIKNEIKSYIAKSGWSLTEIAKALLVKYDIKTTPQNLSNKLTRGTIRYVEVLQIADVIGYKIEWTKKE